MVYELYVVTDEELSPGRSHIDIARQAVAGGADVVQLRDKRRSTRDLLQIAMKICDCTRNGGVLFIVNDRIDLALAAGADGVHLGQDDLTLIAARRIAPRPFIIGLSVRSVQEATQAECDGADYVVVSPVFPTQSKDDAGSGLGTDMVREIKNHVRLPVLGIGGIDPANVKEVITAGADGVAVISAIVCSPDMAEATRTMKMLIRQAKANRDSFF